MNRSLFSSAVRIGTFLIFIPFSTPSWAAGPGDELAAALGVETAVEAPLDLSMTLCTLTNASDPELKFGILASNGCDVGGSVGKPGEQTLYFTLESDEVKEAIRAAANVTPLKGTSTDSLLQLVGENLADKAKALASAVPAAVCNVVTGAGCLPELNCCTSGGDGATGGDTNQRGGGDIGGQGSNGSSSNAAHSTEDPAGSETSPPSSALSPSSPDGESSQTWALAFGIPRQLPTAMPLPVGKRPLAIFLLDITKWVENPGEDKFICLSPQNSSSSFPRGVTSRGDREDCPHPIPLPQFAQTFSMFGILPAFAPGGLGAIGTAIGAITVPAWLPVAGTVVVGGAAIYGIYCLIAPDVEDVTVSIPLACNAGACALRSWIELILGWLGSTGSKPVAVENNQELTRKQMEDIATRRRKPDESCCEAMCTAMAFGDVLLNTKPWERPRNAGWCDTPQECYESCVAMCDEGEVLICLDCAAVGLIFSPFC